MQKFVTKRGLWSTGFVIAFVAFVGIDLGVIPTSGVICLPSDILRKDACLSHSLLFSVCYWAYWTLSKASNLIAALTLIIIAFQTKIYWQQKNLMQGQLRATEVAADAAISAQRPWVKVISVDVVGVVGRNISDQLSISATVQIKNVGSTPAISTWVETDICYDYNGVNDSIKLLESRIDRTDVLSHGAVVFPDDYYESSFNCWSHIPEKPPGLAVIIVGIVAYKFGQSRGTTTFSYTLRHNVQGVYFLRALPAGKGYSKDDIIVEKMRFRADDAT
jgi:hypothetical protein